MKKTAFITGAAKRIGADIATGLAGDGYDLILHYYRSKTEIMALKNQLENTYKVSVQTVSANLADLTNLKQLTPLFKNPIDLLINNASCFPERDFLNENISSFENNFNTNFSSPLFLAQNFIKSQKKGHIINFLDCNIDKHASLHPIYLFAKKSLGHLTHFIAATYGPHFRCNAIAPGYILDPSDAPRTDKQRAEKFKSIPLRQQGNTKQLLSAIRYLEEQAFVTGQTLYVDGGSRLV